MNYWYEHYVIFQLSGGRPNSKIQRVLSQVWLMEVQRWVIILGFNSASNLSVDFSLEKSLISLFTSCGFRLISGFNLYDIFGNTSTLWIPYIIIQSPPVYHVLALGLTNKPQKNIRVPSYLGKSQPSRNYNRTNPTGEDNSNIRGPRWKWVAHFQIINSEIMICFVNIWVLTCWGPSALTSLSILRVIHYFNTCLPCLYGRTLVISLSWNSTKIFTFFFRASLLTAVSNPCAVIFAHRQNFHANFLGVFVC